MRELVEYYWNEQTETAEFLYEEAGKEEQDAETRLAPLPSVTADRETYWSQLKRWLRDEA